MSKMKRSVFDNIYNRMREGRKSIQVLMGPRQIGKTTVINQVLDEIDIPHAYFSADA